jgi:hypothetical protein
MTARAARRILSSVSAAFVSGTHPAVLVHFTDHFVDLMLIPDAALDGVEHGVLRAAVRLRRHDHPAELAHIAGGVTVPERLTGHARRLFVFDPHRAQPDGRFGGCGKIFRRARTVAKSNAGALVKSIHVALAKTVEHLLRHIGRAAAFGVAVPGRHTRFPCFLHVAIRRADILLHARAHFLQHLFAHTFPPAFPELLRHRIDGKTFARHGEDAFLRSDLFLKRFALTEDRAERRVVETEPVTLAEVLAELLALLRLKSLFALDPIADPLAKSVALRRPAHSLRFLACANLRGALILRRSGAGELPHEKKSEEKDERTVPYRRTRELLFHTVRLPF